MNGFECDLYGSGSESNAVWSGAQRSVNGKEETE